MRTVTEPYKFDNLFKKIERSRSQEPKIRGQHLTARITGTGLDGYKRQITIRHYDTDIAFITEWDSETVRIWVSENTYMGIGGGNYATKPSATTKHYLNELLRAYNTQYAIFQKNFTWYWNDNDVFDIGVEIWGSK